MFNRPTRFLAISTLALAAASAALAQSPTTAPTAAAAAASAHAAAADAHKQIFAKLRNAREAEVASIPSLSVFRRVAKTEKGSFLGVVTSAVDPAMRAQLKLARGVGLVVQSVEPGSPAEQATVKQYDVVEKLDDQILVNAEQLSVLIRMRKPADTVQLSVIREGRPFTIKAALIEKDVVAMDDASNVGNVQWATGFPAEGTFEFLGDEGRVKLNEMIETARTNKKFNIVSKDGTHELNLTINDGARHLIVKTADGKEVFNGPIDTEEQRKALPPDIAEKLQNLKVTADIDVDVNGGDIDKVDNVRVKIVNP